MSSIPYRGNLRGSEWHKWDLHVHTPASVVQHYGNGKDDETWERYISALEALPPEIKAIGINDYFLLDGYRRILEAKNSGRLANIELLLPVVELRIASFAGHKDLRRINYHVIFSDELTPDQIDTFFLRELGMELSLEDGDSWAGSVCHREGLIELGAAIKNSIPESKRPSESDLTVGFNHAAFDLDKVHKCLERTFFRGKSITAVGLAEWDSMRWDGGSAAIKKDIINSADLVFTASHTPQNYHNRQKQLRDQQVNSKLIDCSDAHFFSTSIDPNRLGNVFSWLKADLTFQGFQRVIQRFDDRVSICEIGRKPTKPDLVTKNQTKYIKVLKCQSQTVQSWMRNGSIVMFQLTKILLLSLVIKEMVKAHLPISSHYVAKQVETNLAFSTVISFVIERTKQASLKLY